MLALSHSGSEEGEIKDEDIDEGINEDNGDADEVIDGDTNADINQDSDGDIIEVPAPPTAAPIDVLSDSEDEIQTVGSPVKPRPRPKKRQRQIGTSPLLCPILTQQS